MMMASNVRTSEDDGGRLEFAQHGGMELLKGKQL